MFCYCNDNIHICTHTHTHTQLYNVGSVSSSTQKQEVHKVLQYYNPHYFHHHHPTSPPPSGYEEAQQLSTNPVHYQPLHTNTRDYISVYNTTTATGKRTPTVEVESKVYSIVDSTKREIHVYSTPQ